MKNKPKNVFVVNCGDIWGVREADKGNHIYPFDTQKEAITFGKQKAKANKSELKIQGKNGKWRDSISYGHDPNPPKG